MRFLWLIFCPCLILRTSGTLLHVSCACWPYPSFRIVYAIACCWLHFAWGHYKKGLQILTTLSNTVTGRGIGHKCSHVLKPSLHYFFELCLYWSSLRGICCFCVLCYSFAHSLTPCLSFCIISPKKKSSAHLCGDRTNATRLLHTFRMYINCVVLLRQPGTQLFELVASSFSTAFANGFHVCLSRVASYLTSLMHSTFTFPQCWPLTVTLNL